MTGPEQAPEIGPVVEQEREAGPRIYVASLSDYNAGILHGTWLRAGDGVTALREGIEEMLAKSPTTRRYGDVAEEWVTHDYEGFSRYVRLGEYESLAQVSALARGIVEHGEAYAAWWSMDPSDRDDEDLGSRFEQDYQGEFGSLEAYGEDVLDEMGFNVEDVPEIPESLRPYVRIDAAAWARDLEYGGDIATVESSSGVYVFWTH